MRFDLVLGDGWSVRSLQILYIVRIHG